MNSRPHTHCMKTGYRPHILVVEDNADTQLLLQHLLRADYRVSLRSSVQDAIAAARDEHFDLMLLDINLGEELTGIDVLEEIRAHSTNTAVPAIAMTAYAMPGDRERFLEVGFCAYLSKPFSRTLLLSCIDRALPAATRLKKC
jgi:CheY-like chemotaxis protein